MRFDKSLTRTVLFAFGVVSFVIGVYQTVLQNDLGGNYWIFMISVVCWMLLYYWRQQDARRDKEAEVARQVEAMNRPRGNGKKKRRK